MRTNPRPRLRTAAFGAGLAVLVSAVLRGFGPLDLLARVNGIPEWVLRAVALVLLLAAAVGRFFFGADVPTSMMRSSGSS